MSIQARSRAYTPAHFLACSFEITYPLLRRPHVPSISVPNLFFWDRQAAIADNMCLPSISAQWQTVAIQGGDVALPMGFDSKVKFTHDKPRRHCSQTLNMLPDLLFLLQERYTATSSPFLVRCHMPIDNNPSPCKKSIDSNNRCVQREKYEAVISLLFTAFV